MSVIYLIRSIQLFCVPATCRSQPTKTIPLLWEVFSVVPETRQSSLCSLFASKESSGCCQVSVFSVSSGALFLAMPGGGSPGDFQ